MIASGDPAPGKPLPSVAALSRHFGVSSRVAREAIAVLASRGLVRVEHGRGCFVTPRDEWRLVDHELITLMGRDQSLSALFEVRATFEVGMASLAAQRRTKSDIEALARVIEDMETDRRTEAQVEGDCRFHESLALATHNPLFLPLLTALLVPLKEYLTLSQRFPDTANRTHQGHRAIYERIVAGDADGAAEAMVAHLRAGREICERLLREPAAPSTSRAQEVPSDGR